MLIHVTRYTNVQHKVHAQVREVVTRMKQRLIRRMDHESLMSQLKSLWEEDFLPTCAEIGEQLPEDRKDLGVPPWDDVLSALPDVLADIEVRTINGTAKDALDYVENSERGLKVIAIGGDKLARGLTLEGLCVSYFVRTTKMYDTLMQMGRWFGYRPGYIDLCRLYTSGELIEWFGHIADASEELREEFDAMVHSGATPKDYGLKVQSHPVLLVTSPLKMRSAQTLSLSYSGSLVQTVTFLNDIGSLQSNLDATDSLLLAIGPPSETAPSRGRDPVPDEWKRSFLWNGIGSDLVLDYLRAYKTHAAAGRVNSAVLADFIEQMNSVGQLTNWTVALLAEGHPGRPHTFASGLEISTFPSRSDRGIPGRYSIGVLTDPSDEGIDIEHAAWKKALELTHKERQPDPARNRKTPPTRPGGRQLRAIRGFGAEGIAPAPERGLLLVYPLAPEKEQQALVAGWDKPIIGFAISFPASSSGLRVAYKVDHLFWEQEYGAAD